MNPPLRDLELDTGEDQDDQEQDDCSSASVLDEVFGDLVIDEEDDGLHRSWTCAHIELATRCAE